MILIWKNFNSFEILDEDEKCFCSGALTKISTYLRWAGVPSSEIDVAVQDMIRDGNNYAEFGIWKGSYIFSTYKPEYDVEQKRCQ